MWPEKTSAIEQVLHFGFEATIQQRQYQSLTLARTYVPEMIIESSDLETFSDYAQLPNTVCVFRGISQSQVAPNLARLFKPVFVRLRAA
jgi:hypothetical protein